MHETTLSAKDRYWELTILDGGPGRAIAGDYDGDGRIEVVSGPRWFRPCTWERGEIEGGQPNQAVVGLESADIDGDGKDEIVDGTVRFDGKDHLFTIYWNKASAQIGGPWERHLVCGEARGHPHDILVADIDGDGKQEIVVVRMYIDTPGVYIYRQDDDIRKPWLETVVRVGVSGDGATIGDFDGDGQIEIVAGPFLYHAPSDGPFTGPWTSTELAPGLRDMCRATSLDITGNGIPDVVIAESEYPDCRISWFEHSEGNWIEHELDRGYNYIHSLDSWIEPDGTRKIFAAEMNEGGWHQPYNYDARLVLYSNTGEIDNWKRDTLSQGYGTFQAVVIDIDDDGEREILGMPGTSGANICLWKKRDKPSFEVEYRHRFVDRQKPYTGIDLMSIDVDGDGLDDIVCGAWWYQAPTWKRYTVPGVHQLINAYDLDGDGKPEFIAIMPRAGEDHWYNKLSGELVWLKAVDPISGTWEEHYIGTLSSGEGTHGWPHGTTIAPVLPGGQLAFIARSSGPIELFSVPADPKLLALPWPKRTFEEAVDAETRMVPIDLDGDGKLDLVAMWTWLQNMGDGTFCSHTVTPKFNKDAPEPDTVGFKGGEQLVADIDGNGLPDIVACEEHVDYSSNPQKSHFARLAWFENPGDPTKSPWKMHTIDHIRSPHSLAVADLDGDGDLEIVCGEHDPFRIDRSRPKVYIYKRTEPGGSAWTRHIVDDRFDNHVGARLIDLGQGRTGIVSHGWQESGVVHLWEPVG